MQYYGKITNCYTDAVLTACVRTMNFNNVTNFELATTVPFGIKHEKDDVNRILDCYYDPNKGIDRALNILGIPYEMMFLDRLNCNSDIAIQNLIDWCENGNVVVGPINMGDLDIYFKSELYKTMDHYIVVKGYKSGFFCISDPQGIPHAFVSEDNLIAAWKADKIREGYGSYTMRRIQPVERIDISKQQLDIIFHKSVDNLIKAKELKYGGSKCYQAIREDFELSNGIKRATLRRGLSYSIPNRLQRNWLMMVLLNKIRYTVTNSKNVNRVEAIMNESTRVLGKLLYTNQVDRNIDVELLTVLIELERKQTMSLIELKEYINM